jgi:hypothetical protein
VKKKVASDKTNPPAKQTVASNKINSPAKKKGAPVKAWAPAAANARQRKENFASVPKIHQQFSSNASVKEKTAYNRIV